MAGRPTKDTPSRVDPRTGRPLPEGISWRADCQRYQIRVVGPSVGGRLRRALPNLPHPRRGETRAREDDRGSQPERLDDARPVVRQVLARDRVAHSPATARSYGVAGRLRVKPSLGRRRLDEITSPMIKSAMVAWSGVSSAKNDTLAMLSRLLDGARFSRFIDYNPAREVKRPGMLESISPVSRALTLAQIATLLNLIPDGIYRRYFAALVYTGMRAGEATELRVGDVDFVSGVIRVSRSLSLGMRGELIEQSLKSHKPSDVPLIDALSPYAEAAARGKQGSDLLFDGPDGGRLTNHNARRAVNWEELREAIGRPNLRNHDLRHTFATILFDAGDTLPDVQATFGRSSLQITELYSRAREGAALRGGAALTDALKRADENTAREPTRCPRRPRTGTTPNPANL